MGKVAAVPSPWHSRTRHTVSGLCLWFPRLRRVLWLRKGAGLRRQGAGWKDPAEQPWGNVSALNVLQLPSPRSGRWGEDGRGPWRVRALAVNTRCCQSRGTEREGVTEDSPQAVTVVYLPVQTQSLPGGLPI